MSDFVDPINIEIFFMNYDENLKHVQNDFFLLKIKNFQMNILIHVFRIFHKSKHGLLDMVLIV